MPNLFPTGTFSTTGWTISGTTTPWSTQSEAEAVSDGGFSFNYDGTPTPIQKSTLKRFADAAVTSVDVNIAATAYTDTIRGGFSTTSLYTGPNIGINLGVNTVLDLGRTLGGRNENQLSGYGNLAGIRVGTQVFGSFSYSATSGAILGCKDKDAIYGESYGLGSGGLENYGIIALGGNSDEIIGANNVQNSLSYGIINWGLINTGSNSKNDGADSITGTGTLVGIYNFVDLATPEKPPAILTGSKNDTITGQANAGNNGIVNNGLINMGGGDDLFQSIVTSTKATSSFGGKNGTVVMGLGNDIVQGFGSGIFFGDGASKVLKEKIKNSSGENFDSLYLIANQTYTITATSITSEKGKILNGYNISSGGETMRVFGFESFGTGAGDQQSLAVGDFTL